ncbi:MAG: tetratricopeptide repeat protein [Candidatus Pacebacteria bacterium]|nr:tetratricopeptide repeat protein [Candidatus Paceibacterota bacterium]
MLLALIQLKTMINYIFYFFIFLLPIFSVFGFNTAYLILFSFFLLLSQIIKPQKIKYSNVCIISFLFLLLISLSSVFSKNLFISFWGNGGESLIAFISIFIIFFFARLIKKEDIYKIVNFLLFGIFISIVLFLIKGGEAEILAIIISLSLIISLCIKNKKIIVISSILLFSFLIFLNIKIAWFVVVLGSLFYIWKMFSNSEYKDKKFIGIIAIFLISLAFFNFSNSSKIDSIPYKYSLSIAQESLLDNPKNFLIGSGLSTYNYQFSLYKDKEINLINPSIVFNEGSNMLLTFIVTVGTIGVIILLSLIFIVYRRGFDDFLKKDDFIFPALFCTTTLFIFYNINLLLILLFFIFLAFWDEEGKEIKFNRFLLLPIILLFIFIIFGHYNYLKAEDYYNKAINFFNNEEPLIKSIVEAEKATQKFNLSEYNIFISKLYLLKASSYFEERWVTQEKIKERDELIKENVSLSEKYAKKATEIDNNNFEAWQNLGLIYENINFFPDDKTEEILIIYDKAKKLAPQNYEIYFAIGRTLEESGREEEAMIEYKKAFELNPNNIKVIKKIKE